jgi:aspartokinase
MLFYFFFMVSIARTVEKIVAKRPFLQESMSKGIINYGGLADLLLPVIEKELNQKVKHSAVMMSLRRLAEKLENVKLKKLRFSDECNVFALDGLVDISVERNPKTIEKMRELLDEISTHRGDFLATTRGVNELTIITHKRHYAQLKKLFNDKDVITIRKNLSALTLFFSVDFVDTPGLFYLVTKALAWESINIEEIVSTARELTLIVKSSDASRAFDVLRGLLREYS